MKRNAFQKVAELVEMGLKLERAVDDAPDVKDAIKGFWVVMGKGDRGVD